MVRAGPVPCNARIDNRRMCIAGRLPPADRWLAADWNNGGCFLNGWHPDQLAFDGGRLVITLEADTANLTGGRPAVSGEYRSRRVYGHGTFGARLMASGTPGTVSALFLYTGAAEGTRHDEIDMEIKGDDPAKLSVNYWTDGLEHPTVLDLGFDASAGLHDYAFRWTAEALQWFVDGRRIHEERGARGPLPAVAGHLVLSHWGATGAEPWSSSYRVGSAPSRMVVDSVCVHGQDGAPPAGGRGVGPASPASYPVRRRPGP